MKKEREREIDGDAEDEDEDNDGDEEEDEVESYDGAECTIGPQSFKLDQIRLGARHRFPYSRFPH